MPIPEWKYRVNRAVDELMASGDGGFDEALAQIEIDTGKSCDELLAQMKAYLNYLNNNPPKRIALSEPEKIQGKAYQFSCVLKNDSKQYNRMLFVPISRVKGEDLTNLFMTEKDADWIVSGFKEQLPNSIPKGTYQLIGFTKFPKYKIKHAPTLKEI